MLYPVKSIWIIAVVSLFTGAACESKTIEQATRKKKPLVIFQPLKFSDAGTLRYLADSVEKFYPVEVVIAHKKDFPESFYYKPRSRYRADSTIKWLKEIKPDSARSIVGITSEDISVNKGAHKDYGVMGLGYKPGVSCVVSTFRLRKTAISQQLFRQRLFKVVVHEMGHNFGLSHCPDETCIMVDAKGRMKLDKEKDLCGSCKAKLRI
jgi:archaemetzincin